MFAGPVLYAVIAAVLVSIGFGGGWTVNQWRNGAKIAQLESRDAVVTQANAQCKTDVESVQKGVNDLVSHYEGRIADAKAEAAKAQPKADKHTQAAITIVAAPTRKDETLCQAVEREQIEYVESRHASR